MLKRKPIKHIDGFPVFALGLIKQSATFTANAHSELEEYEKTYFWFSERRKLLYFLVKKFFPGATKFCEIGCGGGYVLSGMKNVLPEAELSGTEIFINGLNIAKKRNPEVAFFQADILDFPYIGEFDLIGAFDVIEHLENDEGALKSIFDALNVGGGVIVTVPQHKWLWSTSDTIACHKRRYTRKELNGKLKNAGFKVVWTNSFMVFLLPLMYFSRLRFNDKNDEEILTEKEFTLHPVLNYLFRKIRSFENFLIKIGIRFPLGGSLVSIAIKEKHG